MMEPECGGARPNPNLTPGRRGRGCGREPDFREPVCGGSRCPPRQKSRGERLKAKVEGNRIAGNQYAKAHRLVYHSTLGLRVIKKKKEVPVGGGARLNPKFHTPKPNPNPRIPNQDGADVAVEGNRIAGNQYQDAARNRMTRTWPWKETGLQGTSTWGRMSPAAAKPQTSLFFITLKPRVE